VRLGALVVDVGPARQSREFRLVLVSRTVVLLAAGMLAVAVPVQVYGATGSSLQVGLVSLVLGGSLLAGFLAGGVLADTRERRALILGSTAGVAVAFAALAANAAADSGHQLAVIFGTVAVGGAVEGIGETALTAVTPELVSSDQLAAASGLIAVTSQLGAICGPALGGVAVAAWGLSATYALAAGAMVVATLVLARLGAMPRANSSADDAGDADELGPLRSIREGFSFVRHDRLIAGLLLIDVCATGFGVPATLFPQLAEEVFHGGPEVVGLLATAPAVGALLASLTSGWTGRVRYAGRALVAAVLLLGLAYLGLGLTGSLAVALVFLAVSGAADCVSEILRRALLQRHTPDRLQGRVNSLWLAQAGSTYSLGGVSSGFAAGALGPAAAVAGAGALCVVSAGALAARLPELRRASLIDPDLTSSAPERTE
jgi:ENTS family enterobactin (siderophore) exporter